MKACWKLQSRIDISTCASQLVEHLRVTLKNKEDGVWTCHVFKVLKSFAKEFEGTSYHRKCRRDCLDCQNEDGEERKEFLWDFLAFAGDRPAIIVESEQRTTGKADLKNFMHDFEKLLFACAPIKFMICRSRDVEHANALAKTLEKFATNSCDFFDPGSIFMLHCLPRNGEQSQTFQWQSEGKPPHPKTQRLQFKQVNYTEIRKVSEKT